MALYQHKCPCGADYTDDDPEVYFCLACVEKRKVIAKDIDEKLKGKISKRVSGGFASIVAMGKTVPSDRGGTMTFIRASDLGL